MSWSKLVRQVHRWVSVVFTAVVITVAILTWTQGEPAGWVYVAPGLGLVLLLLTGLYLFVEPYAARWRRR
ncbi:MAG: hypothetical protein PVI57_18080 [Gemmatimonadota bacterium]